MIRVAPAPEPPDFDAKVRQPGLRAIAEMTGAIPAQPRASGKAFEQRTRREVQPDGVTVVVPITRPEDLPSAELESYWTLAIDDLMQAYDEVCAYCCFRIHPVTGFASVDHVAPKSRAWNRVYEWDNYRLAAGRLNARKRDFRDVLDPFEVQNGWFQLELVGFQVHPASDCSDEVRDEILATIERLGLNDKDFRDAREKDALDYLEQGLPYKILVRESPFVASELLRQGRLRDGDA